MTNSLASSSPIPFLTGSTFPLSLIRRRVVIETASLEEYLRRLQTGEWTSFWGHTNTLALANALTGVDLTPKTARPALLLNQENFPTLDGREYRECWVMSPDYRPGFRPVIGQEVLPDEIQGWQILRMQWTA